MAKTVRSPDGRTWRVRRHWVSYRFRWRWPRRALKRSGDKLDDWGVLDHFDVVDDLSALVFVLALVDEVTATGREPVPAPGRVSVS